MSSSLDTAPSSLPPSPVGANTVTAAPSRGSSAVAAAGAWLRRLPAALSRAFTRGVAFVRWLVAAILESATRVLARIGLTLFGGVMLIVVLIGLALTIRSFKPRG